MNCSYGVAYLSWSPDSTRLAVCGPDDCPEVNEIFSVIDQGCLIIDTSVFDQFMDGCFEGVAVGSGDRAARNEGVSQWGGLAYLCLMGS